MAEDKAAAAAVEDDEVAFEAPERGSADELLDAGAHAPIDAMRHSTAHVMAEAVLDLFPGARLGIGPAIDNGFYYDFELPRPLTPDDLDDDRDAHGGLGPADHPFVRREVPFDEGRALEEAAGQSFKVEILDDLAAKAAAAGEPMPRHDLLRPRAVQRPVQGPARRVHGPDRAVQAARGRGRLLARRREAADAPAHLRHGLGDPGGAGPVPVAARGGQEARPPQAGRAARPVQLPRRVARVPPSGTPRAGASTRRLRDAMRENQEQRGYEEIFTPPLVHQKLWERSGHWEHYRDNMFLIEAEGQTFSLKPMNCPESTFIYKSRLRSYRDLPLRLSEYGVLHRNELSGVLSGLTRVRQFVTDDAHIYVRPDQIGCRDRRPDGRGPRGVRVVRPDADAHVRHPPGQGAGRHRDVERDRGDHARGARPVRASTTG